MNSKLHVVSDAKGRPIRMYLSAGQTSDYMGAAALLSSLPQGKTLLADRGYDANWFRNALIDRGIQPCIPSRKNRLVICSIEIQLDLYDAGKQKYVDEGLALLTDALRRFFKEFAPGKSEIQPALIELDKDLSHYPDSLKCSRRELIYNLAELHLYKTHAHCRLGDDEDAVETWHGAQFLLGNLDDSRRQLLADKEARLLKSMSRLLPVSTTST